MELSHYLKVFPCDEQPDYVLLFSTKQTSKILLEKPKYHALLNGSLPTSDETCASLIKYGILVEDRQQEIKALPAQIESLYERNSLLQVIIVLTLDCNFDCQYCFEGNRKGRYYMSGGTREQVLQFIKKSLTPKIKTLRVVFYGGEPLLSLRLLKCLARALQSAAENTGVAFDFSLVSNGSLLTGTVMHELKPLGLRGAQITIDGPADVHNQLRPYRSGIGSFYYIVDNVHKCCQSIEVGLGGNYTQQTYRRFPELLDYLMHIGITPDKLAGIRFSPIALLPEGEASVPCFNEGCRSLDGPWLLEADLFLREEILKRGYHTPPLRPGLCMVEARDSYIINYDGMIYKCPGFLGKRGSEIGDLKTGVRDYTAAYRVGYWKNDECLVCEYLPLCYGGCRYMIYNRTGAIDSINCKRAYFISCLEQLVKLDIKYSNHISRDKMPDRNSAAA